MRRGNEAPDTSQNIICVRNNWLKLRKESRPWDSFSADAAQISVILIEKQDALGLDRTCIEVLKN